MASAEDHLRELLMLSPEERAQAAQILLESLDDDGEDEDAEAAQRQELARRLASLSEGTEQRVGMAEARRRIDARLREIRRS